jgi:hypothetical protein
MAGDPLDTTLKTGSQITVVSNGVVIHVADTEARAVDLLEVLSGAWIIAHADLVRIPKPDGSNPASDKPVTEGGYA